MSAKTSSYISFLGKGAVRCWNMDENWPTNIIGSGNSTVLPGSGYLHTASWPAPPPPCHPPPLIGISLGYILQKSIQIFCSIDFEMLWEKRCLYFWKIGYTILFYCWVLRDSINSHTYVWQENFDLMNVVYNFCSLSHHCHCWRTNFCLT